MLNELVASGEALALLVRGIRLLTVLQSPIVVRVLLYILVPETSRFQMFIQIRLESEGLVTPGTLVVLVSRVGLHVRPQVGPVSKSLATMCTTVRFLPGVTPQVTLK